MLIPEVGGFKLTGSLNEGITATDLGLTVTQMLRHKGVVGRFVEFCEALFATAAALESPRSLFAWQEKLRQVIAQFFRDHERELALPQIRRVLDSLGETPEVSGFDDSVSPDVLLAHPDPAPADNAPGPRFLAGGDPFRAVPPLPP